MSTPQISVLPLERACCRIWRTTSLSTTKVGCVADGFALAFMTLTSWSRRLPKPAPLARAAHRRTEYTQLPALCSERRKRLKGVVPGCSGACCRAPVPPSTRATKSRCAAAHRSYTSHARTGCFLQAGTYLPLRYTRGKRTSAPHHG